MAPRDSLARTVLIVDDSESCAATLEIALLAIPHVNVLVIRSAWEALDILYVADGTTTVLITDLHMPSMDGFELINRVRSYVPTAQMPIVVVTGDSEPSTRENVFRLGADAYFCKPFSVRQLCQSVEALLIEHSS